MNASRSDFGPTLRARREQHGVTLQAIATSTKISVSLLDALERNDLSRWPRGIFRRAYFRHYIAAIGLPAEPLVAEFIRMFPDEPPAASADEDETTPLLLTLEIDARADMRKTWRRAAAAIGEVAGLILIGTAAAHVFSADVWTASGVIALIYYPVANICVERTLPLRSLSSLRALRPSQSPRASVSLERHERGDIASTHEWGTVSQ